MVYERGFVLEENFSSLYILLLGSWELIYCMINVVDGKYGLEMEVEVLCLIVLEFNVVFICKI